MDRTIVPTGGSVWAGALALLAAVSLAAAATVQVSGQPTRGQRNFDARIERNAGLDRRPAAAQSEAEEALAGQVPGLAVTYDRISGAARSLRSHTGYLSGPNPGANPRALALGFANAQRGLLGLTVGDLGSIQVTDEVRSQATGAIHIYMRQIFQGIPAYNCQLQVNLNRDGRIISLNNAFVPDLARSVNTHRPGISAVEAVLAAAGHLGLEASPPPEVISSQPSGQQTTRLSAPGLSADEITASLFWLAVGPDETRLTWNLQIRTLDSLNWYDINVDAVSAEVWTRFDWTSSESFRVYAQPTESPQHTVPLPPADARSLVVDPADPAASPLGWFDAGTTIMDGNNAHACADIDADNACDSGEPSCGAALECDFPIDLDSTPLQSLSAAVTNLFYWNNLIHDIQFKYGFVEGAGNFQETNFGDDGLGSDSVNADAQDGSGNCNANFSTPPDGSNPRMQMFNCTIATPARDGDYDNGIIVHEYGHGISVRQVGGPGNSSCLSNNQQPGEGWSDWFALAYTAEAGDQGTDQRGEGSYLLALPPDGTIRDLPYSTDPAINDWTYESISGAAIPHGVGSRWTQAIWEVYWALVDKHGFDPDLLNPGSPGWSGNQRAMLYVNEGLQNTACSPTFIDSRDGIIQAAADNFGGQDLCTVWEAFAGFGLGIDASTPGPAATTASNGFSLPAACQPCQPQPIADAGPERTICPGGSITLGGTTAQADHTYSWSPGGETAAQITVSPLATATFTLTATTACASASDSVTVIVDDGTIIGLNEDFESGAGGWSATGLWHLASDSACASPADGYSSPVSAFYYGQDATCSYDTGAANSGTLTSPRIIGIDAVSTLSFNYFREVESFEGDFDSTRVEIVSDAGSTTVFSLNSGDPSTLAWLSSGQIDLSPFAGQAIQLRFVFDSADNFANAFIGWFIDDVTVNGESRCVGSPPPTPLCAYELLPSSRRHGPGAGEGRARIFASPGCAWIAASGAGWISIVSEANGSGDGQLSYELLPNPGAQRTGGIDVQGATLTITQGSDSDSDDGDPSPPPPCNFELFPTSRQHGAGAETGKFRVIAPSGCAWSATTVDSWITITTGGSLGDSDDDSSASG